MQRAGIKAEPWEGAPLRMAHTAVLTDTLFPPQEPVTVIKEPFTSQSLGDTKGGKAQEEQGVCYLKGFQGVQAVSGKANNEFPAF